MGKQAEGSLQERIQKLIERNGGYCFKNHGDMTTEPGRPDIVCCYKGYFIAIEAKIDNNTPTRQQGIHCRNVWRAGGIAMIAWDTADVVEVLRFVDRWSNELDDNGSIAKGVQAQMMFGGLDDGTRW